MKKDGEKNRYLLFIGIGIELVALEVGMIFIGREIDKAYQFPGFFVAGFGLSALGLWLWKVVRLLNSIEQEEN